ncbi:MAG: carboxypeptidase M32, partial [Armatimonadetes bacterium]|nr:carboxypeptidase M32 [Armatimonadota bacterium]
RLWENLVARSLGFWRHYYPRLQKTFPAQFGTVPLKRFYRAINHVSPSLIRVEADEVTYNLHILLRYQLETRLLDGSLSVADAPEAWNARMEELIGAAPPTNREGILQDVHWSIGILGYFPTYMLGTVLAAQLYEAALRAIPNLPEEVERGNTRPLLDWLREHVHRHGRSLFPNELVLQATGELPGTAAYFRYLRAKFGGLYGV